MSTAVNTNGSAIGAAPGREPRAGTAAVMPHDARRPAEPDDTDGGTWAAMLAAWDVVPGSSSEAALATAVLLDAHRHPRPVVEAARVALARRAARGTPRARA